MPRYLDTTGNSTLSIGICARCKSKYPLGDLTPDPNSPGLLCCPDGCLDVLDPWRLPARAADRITVDQPRPDVMLVPNASPVYVAPLQAVIGAGPGKVLGAGGNTIVAVGPSAAKLQVPGVWNPVTPYAVGAQVTPTTPYGPGEVGLDIFLFTCIVPGFSGPMAPLWPEFAGVPIQDNQVTWINAGVFLG